MKSIFSKEGILKNTSGLFLLVFLITFLINTNTVKALSISPVRLELAGNRGESVVSKIQVINTESVTKTYFTNIYTFEAGDEDGNPVFRIVKTDLASWINVPEAITLGPKESKILPLSITIPKDAESGGYFASVFLTQTPPKTSQEGDVSVASELGELVLLRVNGDFKEGADILEFDTKNHSHWFTSLPITFYYRFQNLGQNWARPLGDVVVKNIIGKTSVLIKANKNEGNVLPQSIRKFEITWGNADFTGGFWSKVLYQWKNFAFGPYTINLNLAYGVQSLQSATAKTSIWVFPWQLLVVLLLGGTILFYLLRKGIRTYNAWVIANSAGKSKPRNKK